jgi:hypothetical protein
MKILVIATKVEQVLNMEKGRKKEKCKGPRERYKIMHFSVIKTQ